VHELGIAFCARASSGLTPSDELERDLAELVGRARREADEIDLDPLAFVGYVAERVTFDAGGHPQLHLRAGDLWIAFGCVTGNAAALTAFEARFAPEITSALRRSFEPALAEDAELQLREKLMLVTGESAPRLASYAGRGALGAWLRAAAVRMAIDIMRARREVPSDPSALGDAAALDPLLASLKQRYRDEFRTAFNQAADALSDRDRTLLRYRFVEGLSIDEIGRLYSVHRATVARWIAAIREDLFEATRARLMERLAIADNDLDSVLRLIDSQLDISIAALAR
jgi:RNA polymerase sigma-70 factor (ECF subfamily)